MSRPDDPAPLPYAGGLTPYTPGGDAPWTPQRAAHLLRRSGFGAPPERIAEVLADEPRAVVARLVSDARRAPLPPRPDWADLAPLARGSGDDAVRVYRAASREAQQRFHDLMLDEATGRRVPGTGLREKLAIAWHVRIPTRSTHLFAHNYDYWATLREHALGSYRDLVGRLTVTPALLFYLDGRVNRATAPNENYARELLELFTLGPVGPDGQPPYTQRDVTEMARALTGWTAQQSEPASAFRPRRADRGDKTLFGVTGPFDVDGALDVVFSARAEAASHHLASHLYRTFVHAVPQPQVVGEMAERLRRDDFVVAGTVEALLGSAHFFATPTLGALVKSPYEHALGLVVDFGVPDPQPLYRLVRIRSAAAGFQPFRPVDVSGWPGGRAWLDTTRLPLRWRTSDELVERSRRAGAVAREAPAPDDPDALVDALAERFLAVPLAAEARQAAVDVLLGGIPPYEWRADAPGADARVRECLLFLFRLPEYQLT